ncbi:hypothetical protein A2803_04640 [Candidatus Woesebacteria bacterium RIFCSPHIGHO2_01_FULL_44_21]|uniref:Glycosyltransferase RgtA/B/C/D-like domain-containing protein n=1 Tax=Candidatus Woesebacteria bacterium RIFCSPHIGHO2_01_FULL_44_21 TaxID=1802503 RepID=A0A1F7YXP1_9BACT|nr:MAG: hypothetical protein A2803_04640 [Candidatus Woesebacteria bacterium RIFCSPHIGHO2_01_FULL_44_21]OGM71359.1 MAG: hypothetical protein A2897_01005 [Candidatus Woesebacteria bacterium RIFCSPLOWO2_01_FULL_44_24b]
MNVFLILLSIFGNIWVYKISQESLVYFVICATAAVAFIFYLSKNSKLSSYLALASFTVLIVLGLFGFELRDFTITNDEIRVRDERLSIYPTNLLQIGYYLDAKPEVLVARKVLNGVVKQLDPNIYFFAGHPRERIGVDEFEKIPYILLPVFLLGLYQAIKNKKVILVLFVIPLLINSLNTNSSVNSSLFPFFVSTIYLGLVQSIKVLKKYKFKIYIYALFIFFYLLTMLQIISYEIY